MQQYREGQRLQGSDGKTYVVRNGVPVSDAPSPAMGPAIGNDPRIPGTIRAQSLQAERTAQEITNNPLNVANTQAGLVNTNDQIRSRQIGNVADLRKEYNALPEVKNYADYLTQMSKALRAPKNAQGDLSIIYAFAKAMDPGSVVREGEMDMANSTSSYVQDLYRRFGQITDGNRLPENVRTGLVESIRSAGHGFKDAYDQQYLRYRDQAAAIGADPNQVVGNHRGDAFRALEENYIRETRAGMANAGQKPEERASRGRGLYVVPPTAEELAADPSFIGTFVNDQGLPPKDAADLQKRINDTDAFGAGQAGFADALTAGLSDEAAAGLNSIGGAMRGEGSFSDLYKRNLGVEQAYQDALRERNPYWFLGGNVAGAVTGMAGLNGALQATRLAPLATAGGGIGSDMLYGGAYGYGSENDNRLMGAVKGAGAAGLGNVIGNKVVAPGIRGAVRQMGFETAPALPAAQNLFAGQINKAGDDALAQIKSAADLGLPFAPVDAAPQLRSLGGSVVRKSPDAYAAANQQLGARPMGQADRLTTLVNNELAPTGDIGGIVENSLKRARSGSKDLYNQALSHPAPDDAALREILSTPAGGRAARSAYDRAVNAGESPASLSYEIDAATGEPRLMANPNWRTLQYMKFELDGMAQADKTLVPLSRKFNTRLSRLNDDFRKANKAYGDIAKQGSAAQAGYDAAAPGVSPANLGLPKDNLNFYQQGYASRMADTAGKMRRAGDPYEAVYGSPWQQQKLPMVFPNGAPRFTNARGLEKEMSLTNKELFGGSPTQPRAEADKLFDGNAFDDAADFGLSMLAGTPPISAFKSKLFGARGLANAAQDVFRLGVGNRAKAKAEQLAPMLFNPNADETYKSLIDLVAAKRARDEYVRRTGMFGSSITAPLALTYGLNQ